MPIGRGRRAAGCWLSTAGRQSGAFGRRVGKATAGVVIPALPYAPAIVLPTMRHRHPAYPPLRGAYGFTCTRNPTDQDPAGTERGWSAPHYDGGNAGPLVGMIANYPSARIWRRLRRWGYTSTGLRQAGCTGG